MWGVLLSLAGLVAGFAALASAVYTLRIVRAGSAAHLQAQVDEVKDEFAKLKHAFGKLEADAEDIWDKAQSHLGRISRMKRELKLPAGAELAAAVADANAARLNSEVKAPSPDTMIDPDRLYADWIRMGRH